MDLGPDRRREPIGSNGQAYFPSVPPNFRAQEVRVWVDSEQFESAGAAIQRLNGSSLYLPVRRRGGAIKGYVQDAAGKPLVSADVQVMNLSARTNGSGYFEIPIPGNRMKQEFELTAIMTGYRRARYTVVPNSNN
jgi:hypothetical protein